MSTFSVFLGYKTESCPDINSPQTDFYFIYLFKLEFSCFPMLCQVLLYYKMNQPLSRHTFPPPGASLPTISPPTSSQNTKLGSCVIYQLPTSCLIHCSECMYINVTLSSCQPLLSPPQLPMCPGPSSTSVPLPCKQVHLYHFSRFHIYVLVYNICFSLSKIVFLFLS